MNKSIYVIIVTWNGMKWIQKCLDALRQSTYPVTVLMIDNLSTDETVSFVKDNYREVRIFQSEKNLGFGQANNVGMRIALKENADYVYLLNQDAYVYPDMFEKLIHIAEVKKDYAILSPLHVQNNGQFLDSQFKDYFEECASDVAEDMLLGQEREIYPVSCVPAAGWLLSISTLNNIGGFDPIYFHYGEDVHYAQRVKYHGYKIGIVPSAMMIHDREGFGNFSVYKKGEILRSQEAYGFLDITLSTNKRWMRFLRSYMFFAYDVVKGNFKMAGEYLSSFLTILRRLPLYRRDRKQNRQKGANWL